MAYFKLQRKKLSNVHAQRRRKNPRLHHPLIRTRWLWWGCPRHRPGDSGGAIARPTLADGSLSDTLADGTKNNSPQFCKIIHFVSTIVWTPAVMYGRMAQRKQCCLRNTN